MSSDIISENCCHRPLKQLVETISQSIKLNNVSLFLNALQENFCNEAKTWADERATSNRPAHLFFFSSSFFEIKLT